MPEYQRKSKPKGMRRRSLKTLVCHKCGSKVFTTIKIGSKKQRVCAKCMSVV